MKTPKIKSTKPVVPMIYAYTTPGISYHDGYIKIGYTEQDVDVRIKQQTHTAGIKYNKEWQGTAIFDDGSGDRFKDTDFHAYMRSKGVKQPMDLGNDAFAADDKNEWFYIEPNPSRTMFYEFKSNRGIVAELGAVPYTLRDEQAEAVKLTKEYFIKNEKYKPEFLWNAKPRFGKTLAAYDLCKALNAKNILIVTNRPAIANSWYSDYKKFFGPESGYYFVSTVDGIKDKEGVYSREKLLEADVFGEDEYKGCIEFVSLQDLKGSIYFGGQYDKLGHLYKGDNNTKAGVFWDVLIVDEAHEGVDTYKTDVAFDNIARKYTLHLSGTPFKALANDKFNSDAIYNWTYADEQAKKKSWDNSSEIENPYINLPKLNLYTYQMSEIVRDELVQGVEIQGETVEYAFDLNEFFRVENGRFVHNSSVDKFLDALTLQTKFPFSTDELRNELKHTFWLLDRVESARLMAKKLHEHPVFKDYEIVLAAGDGRIDDDDENEKSFDKVVKAISEYDKTITLSVGQLTTGITIPEWTGVLMLSNVKSPALYMQAAFRAQNPCLFHEGAEYKRKKNAYVFDFDPARTLIIFEEFANDLSPHTASGKGSVEDRKENIMELLNFFPVIGEDEEGELIKLDAEKVLSIPRKIKSAEVVRRGFMSNFLFQNISNVFSAPKDLLEIIEKFEPVDEPKNRGTISEEVKKDLSLNDDGEVELSNEYVIGKAADLFGEKQYDVKKEIQDVISYVPQKESTSVLKESIKNIVKENIVKDVVKTVAENYGSEIRASDKRQIEAKLNNEVERMVETAVTHYTIQKNIVEQKRVEAMQKRHETGKTTDEIEEEFIKKNQEEKDKLEAEIKQKISDFSNNSMNDSVRTVETNIKNREKNTIEAGIRDHLRGFSRTIPSFLMAYGDDTVTLATFDNKVPDKVFMEVTSISLAQFRFLRDGGTYTDSETGEEKEFKGQLFDSVVFDDSVKEFLALKKKLANYFDEKSIEDIFDYIPPQKTNQIFTPKNVVKHMVDMLEEENPGCFDDKDKTFIDLYMKSGLYITEIVKRLYQSEKMKKQFPDDKERLKHIFAKQVYGLAPTEIIYKIATSYILGFADNTENLKHNFVKEDALPYAKGEKDISLQERLYELFGK
ncbi:DEAD/DEAH box helicase family protein [Anaerovibrio sp.]|uniref:DEAD/DEAH box helicase n=1 Tax=Anaerovibrio sp. TaxID=1872532 RepID=UPI0025C54D21|nr:DEAD/DEAH box helicase family protein [Anaerovibrio sp.]MBR2142656.1 DEAD/DEAH box helicase family protein [Anaerovibrio sp.]